MHRYPAMIVVFFGVVFLMNAVFITIAITGADPVDPSYLVEENRR